MGATDPAVSGDAGRARRLAKLSLWMLVVFAAWTVVYMFAADPVARLLGYGSDVPGEVVYVEAWLPWIGITLLWLAPVIVGLVLAGIAAKRGGGRLAWWGIGIHGLLLAFFTIPNVIERLTTL